MIVVWYFYYEKYKNFFRSFADIKNLFISLYGSYVGKHIDDGEHVGSWYSIQLWINNMGDTCLVIGALLFT